MLTESFLLWGAALLIAALIVVPYLLAYRRRRRDQLERRQLSLERPTGLYPYIDPYRCLGCGECVAACPEGGVLDVVFGTAEIIDGTRCAGHARCEEVCPVGAIEAGVGDLRSRVDVPVLDETLQTSVPGVYVAGELGGLTLTRNAVRQGRRAVEAISRRIAETESPPTDGLHDLAIVGAGPAGLSAALTASAADLDYVLLEREPSLGNHLLHFPRRKMVLREPVELPPWGRLERDEYRKEKLLEIFESIVEGAGLRLRLGQAIESIKRQNGHFLLKSSRGVFRARAVLLTLGRRGSPRKLKAPGEELPKVMYRVMDARSYRDQKILVVGGGDGAVEAVLGLARQPGNELTLSYRKKRLVRLRERNQKALDKLISQGKVRLIFSSRVQKIEPHSVTLEVEGEGRLELENDYVFVFLGIAPPFRFLRKSGIEFGKAGQRPSESDTSATA